jgi:DNA-binding transcriptional ArsR family regulator
MVHYTSTHLDGVFSALADPTRRAVLMRLRAGEQSVGDLADPFGMSLTGFIKHLAILEEAGLIERNKVGRVVNCRLKGGALKAAMKWLDRHEAFWSTRLDRLGTFLDTKEQAQWKSPPKSPPASKSDASTSNPPPTSTRRGRTRRS